MLKDKPAVATVAVRDLERGREFYGGVLGLEELGERNSEVATFRSGASQLMVYRSELAGTNQATAVNWQVGGEVDAIAAALASKGVPFERYEFEGVVHDGPVHVIGDFRTAWFRDPDGNILSLVSD